MKCKRTNLGKEGRTMDEAQGIIFELSDINSTMRDAVQELHRIAEFMEFVKLRTIKEDGDDVEKT